MNFSSARTETGVLCEFFDFYKFTMLTLNAVHLWSVPPLIYFGIICETPWMGSRVQGRNGNYLEMGDTGSPVRDNPHGSISKAIVKQSGYWAEAIYSEATICPEEKKIPRELRGQDAYKGSEFELT